MVYGNERLVCLFSHVIGDSPFDVFKQVLQTYFGQPQLESFCSVCSSDIEPLNLLYLKYFSFLSDICLLPGYIHALVGGSIVTVRSLLLNRESLLENLLLSLQMARNMMDQHGYLGGNAGAIPVMS